MPSQNLQKWNRLGQLYSPDGTVSWMRSHAANPVAVHIAGDRFQVYFSARDQSNRSSIGSVELDIYNPESGIRLAPEPLVSPGRPGSFDDSGISLGSVCDVGGRRRLYYLGWNLGVTVPFTNFIGLASGDPRTGKYSKFSEAPIIGRSAEDPLSLSYPFVLQDGETYRMWYGSTRSFGSGKSTEEMDHIIKTAVSKDGIAWVSSAHICIERSSAEELGISRPTVIKEAGLYRMWYSYRQRKSPYTIGYAESPDGANWTRCDQEFTFLQPPAPWESAMVCYPHVFLHNNKLHMVYCGNDYGRTGFGLAVLD